MMRGIFLVMYRIMYCFRESDSRIWTSKSCFSSRAHKFFRYMLFQPFNKRKIRKRSFHFAFWQQFPDIHKEQKLLIHVASLFSSYFSFIWRKHHFSERKNHNNFSWCIKHKELRMKGFSGSSSSSNNNSK